MFTSIEDRLEAAAEAIERADAIFIGAGAGMGVDSGLPDFRGANGFWRAYPPYRKLGLEFTSVANPRWFREDPELAWGFYGHRLHLYRDTQPHDGFQILRMWAEQKVHGAFVYTSNVDGHFQRVGFDSERVIEVHGSIHWMQCLNECGIGVFSAESHGVCVDETTLFAEQPLPLCPRCTSLARPNILMFGDADFDGARVSTQRTQLADWLKRIRGENLVVIECGAGSMIPTVRLGCEDVADRFGGTLIRINTQEHDAHANHIGLPMGALEALGTIDEVIAGNL